MPGLPPSPERKSVALAALLAALAVALWCAWSPPGRDDLVGGDEGYYGTMARNVSASARQVLSPSLSPLGPPGDKPPLYPAILAVSLGIFGVNETGMRLPSLVLAFVTIVATAWIVACVAGATGGILAALLLPSLPWFADASRSAGGEVPLTAFGVAGLAVLAGNRVSRRRAALAGLLVGCAFLCKLWVVAPIALACVARIGFGRGQRGALAWFAGVAALVGSAQLVGVALLQREDLAHWLGVYFGTALGARLGGAGFAGSWVKHPLFYASMLAHALALLAPLAAAGLEQAIRRRREPLMRALLAWAAGLLLVSLFRVKAGGYAYPIVPALVALAAIGARELVRGATPSWRAILAGALLTAPPLLPEAAGARLPLVVWSASWGAMAGVRMLKSRSGERARWAGVALVVAVIALSFGREWQRLSAPFHTPGYRAVVARVAPMLRDVPPQRPALVTPEAPAFQFHLFRTARYWGTPVEPWSDARAAAIRADTALRVFVVDPSRRYYGGWPDSAMLRWLETSTTEITGEIRPASGLRVFTR